jgi:hypothetical protein
MAISCFIGANGGINGYWYLFYWWPLVAILLVVIDGYSFNGYKWLLY